MRLNIKHIDLFGGGMQDFPTSLKASEPIVKPVSYPNRSYSTVIFPSVPISTLLTKQSRSADFALGSLIS